MGRDRARPSSGNFELLNLLFDFVDEVGGTGAVDDSMIEGQRERDDFGTPNAPRLVMTTGAFIASTRPPRVASTVSL